MSFEVRFSVRPSELKDGMLITRMMGGGLEEVRTVAKVSDLSEAAKSAAQLYGRPCAVWLHFEGKRKPAGFDDTARRIASVFHKGLDPAQIAALRAFAEEHGEHWKAELGTLWMRAAARPELHALRNSHGPEWLSRFELFAEGAL